MNTTEPCLICGKKFDAERDVDNVAERTGIQPKYFYHCPRCCQLLTFDEAERLRRRRNVRASVIPSDR